MVTFRNNNNVRRNNFRRNDRSFKSNLDRPKYGSNFTKNENFQRKSPGRNNHNAPKLIEKYTNDNPITMPGNPKPIYEIFSINNENLLLYSLSQTVAQHVSSLDVPEVVGIAIIFFGS